MEELQTLSAGGGKQKAFRLLGAGEGAGRFKDAFLRLLSPREGCKKIPWKSIPVRNVLIAGSALLILLAAYLNLRFAKSPLSPEDNLVAQPGSAQVSEDDYFAVAVINRSRVRDEAIDMYQALADDATVSQNTREEAYASMNALVDRTAMEVDIENRVRAKGFSNCVAILEDDRANVIVQSTGLTDAEVAQITEIVYLQAGVIPQNLTITERV